MISDKLEEAGNEWNKGRSNGINFKYFTPDFVSFLLLLFFSDQTNFNIRQI